MSAPELPALGETLPGFGVTAWQGILAPAGTPEAIVAKISGEIGQIVKDRHFAKSMLDLGAVMTSDTPAEFAAFMSEDHAKWLKVIRDAGIKLE